MKIKNSIIIIIVLILASLLAWKLYPHNTPTPVIPEEINSLAPVVESPTSIIEDPQLSTPPIVAPSFSAWLWDSPDTFTEINLRKMFQLAKDDNITTVYLRMDDYTDLYQMKDRGQRILLIKKLDDAAARFITLAKDYDIKVQALGGNTGWAQMGERSYPHALFSAIVEYNNTHAANARFVGVQFDVEAYNSDLYKEDKTATLTTYLDFVQEMIDKKQKNAITANSTFALGFAIPSWYDNENNNGVVLDWQNKGAKPVAYHLFDILNNTTGGYVVIMDYRNYADGKDGSIANAKNELVYASENTPRIKIIIGQETSKVLPSKITFYDTSKKYFKEQVAKLLSAFAGYSVFGGVAIHHLPSYIDL